MIYGSRDCSFVFGANFLPSTAANGIEMWQSDSFDPDTIARELGFAARWGYNSVRVFLSFVVWKEEGRTFLDHLEKFLQIADGLGFSVMPVLFDDCRNSEGVYGKRLTPILYKQNSLWCSCPGDAYVDCPELLKDYEQSVLKRFSDDERILMWDLFNEPGNGSRGIASMGLLRNAFAWAREIPLLRPLTVGIWGYRLEPDNQELRQLEQESLRLSDIVSFHNYENPQRLKEVIAQLKEYGKPLICTEWMARQLGSTLRDNLPVFLQENIGCFQWGIVNGRTQTHYPWSWQEMREPEDWFHDIMKSDGTPFDLDEMEYVRKTVNTCDFRERI